MVMLTDFDTGMLLFLIGVMVFSGLVHGTLGLGFPMVATPILAIFLDVRSAILITLLPTVAVNLATIFSSADWVNALRRFTLLIICSLLGGIAGSFLLASVDPNPFRLVLALLIILFLTSSALGRIPLNLLEKHETLAMTGFGLLAGLSAGTTNVMVAVLLIYLLSLQLERDRMVPVLNMCFLFGKLSQFIVFVPMGLVSVGATIEGIPLALAALAALFAGQRISNRISTDSYRKILEWLLVFLAIILIFQFVNALL